MELLSYVPSVYFADSFVQCELEAAWRILLDYEVWNPTFVGARVTPIEGAAGSVGERVLISKTFKDPKTGERFPEFYAETVKIVPGRRIVWYCYAKEGQTYHNQKDPFRNFVDFGLTQEPGGVRFSINYYAQNRMSAEEISNDREMMQSAQQSIADAFREYCQQHSGKTG